MKNAPIQTPGQVDQKEAQLNYSIIHCLSENTRNPKRLGVDHV